MRRSALSLIVSLAALGPAGTAVAAKPVYRIERLQRLDFPTGLGFTPSGTTLFVNERSGRVRIIRDGVLRKEPFARVETTTSGEGGLLGLAVDPRFDDGQPWVYVFYTLPDGSADRVERLRWADDRVARREVLMARLPSGSSYHHGGILAFGPDGMLYVTNGEAHDQQRAQDPKVLGGKIYRIKPDGSIPSDNPFGASPTWSYGHRNPFGLAFDPATGSLWESENGPENHDEVNLIKRGANYGWPIVRGDTRRAGFVPAAVDYEEIVVPTGLAFAPTSFAEPAIFLGTLGDASIRELTLSARRDEVTRDRVIARASPIAMTSGSDGIYITTPERLLRLRATNLASSASPKKDATPTPSPTDSGAPSPSGENAGIGFVIITAAVAGGYWAARAIRRTNRPRPRGPWFGGRES